MTTNPLREKIAASYTKKPVTIQAIQYTGDNLRDVLDFTGKHPRFAEWFSSFEQYETHVKRDRQAFKIITLEGTMEALPGDWIIRGVKGEHYPCKPDIFAATYDPAILDAHPEQPAPDAAAEAWTSDWQWWAGSASDEMMTVGPCATREQAIEEAVQDGFGEWQDTTQDPPVWRNTFVVCECRQDPLRLADWIGADWILERSDEALVDSDRVSSEFDDGPWFEASPDQEADLGNMLKTACDEWQRKHNLKFSCCTFSHSRNHETVTTDALRTLASQKETQG